MMLSTRRLTVVTVAAITVLAAGCGASSRVGDAQGNSTVSRSHAPICRSSQLTLTAGPAVSEATEQDTVVFEYRNISRSTCVIDGYPMVILMSGAGRSLAYKYRDGGDQMLTSRPPTAVSLPAGGVAFSAINKNSCVTYQQSAAVRAEVIPPGNSEALVLRLPRALGYCGANDLGHMVDVAPVEPAEAAVRAQN
jgi:hypothetical protein